MAKYGDDLAKFVQDFGEDAVVTAFNQYRSHRERSQEYAETRKQKNALVNAILSKAADPKVKATLESLGIKL